ncbi:hypothetical protein AFIC_002570 [[Pseudomonas] carboxydohydrogena]|uniref:Uncharacterized protein n=1 Tax=Afipia carboxydohydrogena TaxID=290 RepID=A0ABY8BLZ5_AFICR|nr:hypothetical protein [[Pseudomonas] carboxydohydrogena]WEF51008.1 hypothetical protein AFIC_002570 [[Pseudomonas] carboxydohydrogena]
MIEPIKPGDELFPYDIEIVDGKERVTRKKDWTDEKQVALDIRTIDYLLQFKDKHGSVALINMIAGNSIRAMEVGTVKQKDRFRELLALREEWLHSRSAA